MLGINLNLSIDAKKIQSPFYFQHRNECVSCGGKGTLVFVDRFGRESNREINALDHIRCKNCGKRFSILWEPKEGTDKMMPSAVDSSVIRDFKNIIQTGNLRKNGEKELY